MPTSSLARVFDVSTARAQKCTGMLAGLAETGGGRVDVNDFFLHEAMAQVGGDSTGRGTALPRMHEAMA